MKTCSTRKKPAKKLPASSKAGLTGILDADPRTIVVREVASKGTDLVFFGIKVLIVAGLSYWGYGLITNRFQKKPFANNLPAANISDIEASSRAKNIITEASGWSMSLFDVVKNSITGLNYNGYIKLYNAFGHQEEKGFLPNKVDLTEWIKDRFSSSQVQQLSFLLNGVFF